MANPLTNPTALIAEDEHLLAAALKAELATVWPDLAIVATVGDGASAVQQALALRPDVLFFDIQMPGMSGLDAALALADDWPDGLPFPALIFVTAFDQYALQAFEAQAIDYVLKPVQTARLQKTVAKVQSALQSRTQSTSQFDDTLAQLRALVNLPSQAATETSLPPAAPLAFIQASVGSSIKLVPVAEVLYFEASDKYIRVLTQEREYLIRTPLKDLLPQLDLQQFWQVHRGTVVRASHIEAVTRDEAGKLWLALRGLGPKIGVSRLYAHLFKAM